AEDGIRDGHVTGVQTCALPIFEPMAKNKRNSRSATSPLPQAGREHSSLKIQQPSVCLVSPAHTSPLAKPPKPGQYPLPWRYPKRSEERRVGKEGRYRRAAAQ